MMVAGKVYGGKYKQKQAVKRITQKKVLAQQRQIEETQKYEGKLGALDFKKGKLKSDQNLNKYKVEYYDDGVTPKKILGNKKIYTAYKYGNSVRDKADYYANQWEFNPDGTIRDYSDKYHYKDSKGDHSYSYLVSDKQHYHFGDKGILKTHNKYDNKRIGDNDWDNQNVYTAEYQQGQKAKEYNRQWSNRDRNWYKISTNDYTTGKGYTEGGFMSYAPKVQAPVLSSRVKYKPHPTQPGGLIPDLLITTYKDGLIKVKDAATKDKAYFVSKTGKPIYAGQVDIPELGISRYKNTKLNNQLSFVQKPQSYNVLTSVQKPQSFYTPPPPPNVNVFDYRAFGKKSKENETSNNFMGFMPFSANNNFFKPRSFGGQNIGNKIKDYASEFKLNQSIKKQKNNTNFLKGKI